MKRSSVEIPLCSTMRRRRVDDEPAATCIGAGLTHQGSDMYEGNNSQCTVISACASIYSVFHNRASFTTAEIDEILRMGDTLYMQLKYLLQRGVSYFMPDELPNELRVGDNVAHIVSMEDNWIISNTYPTTPANKDIGLLTLKNILDNRVFFNTNDYTVDSQFAYNVNNSNHNDSTDSILFTGQGYTFSFWRFNGEYYFFNSHAVNSNNINIGTGKPEDGPYVARLFKCNSTEALAKLLLANEVYDGSEYSLTRLRVLNDDLIWQNEAQVSSETSQSILVDLISSPLLNENQTLDSILMNYQSTLAPLKTSVQNFDISKLEVDSNPVDVYNTTSDIKLTILKPVVLLERISSSTV
ncbi:uncharacterized protein LOC126380822 [Pectinophora gossypiella]|uniref:uncharacterized protein LOC126380822 n=1 Tax=Pectinophora gossypiella TaxID=13191 RepID=UPI00214EAA93|nr:uncharacterized protein LOC126380822 [Pectinophora gossypiella]